MDSTIPRHGGTGTVIGAKIGRFVFDAKDRVVLVDQDGVRYRQGYYQLLQGAFGDGTEGFEKLPRPWRYQGKKVTRRGDLVLLQFLDGDPKRPVVIGGVRQVGSSDFFHYDHASKGADWNRVRFRVVPRDPDSDEVLGELSLHIADDFPLWRRFLRNPIAEEGPAASAILFTDSPWALFCADRALQNFNDPGEVLAGVEDVQPDLAVLFRAGEGFGTNISTKYDIDVNSKGFSVDTQEDFDVRANGGFYGRGDEQATISSGETEVTADGSQITLRGPSTNGVHPVVYDRGFTSALRNALLEAKAACTANGLPTTAIDSMVAQLSSGAYVADDTRCS